VAVVGGRGRTPHQGTGQLERREQAEELHHTQGEQLGELAYDLRRPSFTVWLLLCTAPSYGIV